MAEQKAIQKGFSFQNLVSMTAKCVVDSDAKIYDKGTATRFSADLCNSVVKRLQLEPECKGLSHTQIKLALPDVFKAIVENKIATDLGTIEA